MRVGVDIRSLLDQPLTGVGEYTLNLLDALAKLPHGGSLVLFANSFRSRPVLPPDLPSHRVTMRHHHWPNKLLNASIAVTGAPALERFTGHVDCFFAPNINFLALHPETPLVLTVHDLSFHYYPSLFSRKRRLWHRLIRPEKLIERAQAIIAVSRSTAEDLKRAYHVPSEKITVVHSGVRTLPVSEADQAAARVRYRLPETFVLALATLEPRKNFLTVLEAFGILRREGFRGHLVIVGAQGWSSGPLEHALARHPDRGAIHVLPYVTEQEKHCLYRQAGAFLYCSLYEGFGFPPLEAALHGTPVITGAHSSLSEVLGKAALLVDVYNARDIATATRLALEEEGIRRTLEAELPRLRDAFRWERAAAETFAVFQRVVDRHAHPY